MMQTKSRRSFVTSLLAGGGVLFATTLPAQTPGPKLEESDPQATALGYKADASTVDKAKFPQHQANQVCGGCNFFQGKPADAMAPCQLFGGKQVSSKGWCAGFAAKAA